MATKEELKEAIREVLGENPKEVIGNICPTCHNPWDIRHQLGKKEGELEKATAETEKLKAEVSLARAEADTRAKDFKELQDTHDNLVSHLSKGCPEGIECPTYKSIINNLNPHIVGDWIKDRRGKEGK